MDTRQADTLVDWYIQWDVESRGKRKYYMFVWQLKASFLFGESMKGTKIGNKKTQKYRNEEIAKPLSNLPDHPRYPSSDAFEFHSCSSINLYLQGGLLK